MEPNLRGHRVRSRRATAGVPGSMSALAGRSRVSPPPSVRPNITLRRLGGGGAWAPTVRGWGTRWPPLPRALTRPRPRGGAATEALRAQVVCFGSGRLRPPGLTNRERARGWGVRLCGRSARPAAQVGAPGPQRPPWGFLLLVDSLRDRATLPRRADTFWYPHGDS